MDSPSAANVAVLITEGVMIPAVTEFKVHWQARQPFQLLLSSQAEGWYPVDRDADPVYRARAHLNDLGYVRLPLVLPNSPWSRSSTNHVHTTRANWMHLRGRQLGVKETCNLACQSPLAYDAYNTRAQYHWQGYRSIAVQSSITTIDWCKRCMLAQFHPSLNELQVNVRVFTNIEVFVFTPEWQDYQRKNWFEEREDDVLMLY